VVSISFERENTIDTSLVLKRDVKAKGGISEAEISFHVSNLVLFVG